MKRDALAEIKKSDKQDLTKTVAKVRKEIAALELDRVSGKIVDFKSIGKKRRDLAQILTVLRQKELVEQLEKGEEQNAG